MWKNVKRNENRIRRKSGRARTNPVNSMTPQGQALWASKNVGNAFGFIGPAEKPRKTETFIKAQDMSISEVTQ